jgi:vancomycin resistance protein YoaR
MAGSIPVDVTVLEAVTLRSRRRRALRAPVLLAVGGALALVAAVPAARVLLHADEAMPGVSVLGADLGGTSEAQVPSELRSVVASTLREPVGLRAGGRVIWVPPSELFTLDRPATVEAVMDAGRGSFGDRARSLLSPLTDGVHVDPVLVERPQARRRLSARLDRFSDPPRSAAVVLRGLEPSVRPSRDGTVPDLDGVLAGIRASVGDPAAAVPVDYVPTAPAISNDEARRAAEEARLMISSPVSLEFDGRAVRSLTPVELARLTRFREVGSRLVPIFNAEGLERVLDPAVSQWKRRAKNAQFAVDGAGVRIVPSLPGLGLDGFGAAAAISTAAHSIDDRHAALRLVAIQPDRTTADAEALGIRERVSTFTTEMGPSSSNRIHNVQLMARYIDGTIVKPGQTFSFNKIVGPRTTKRGFLEGQMIVGSLLLPSVGGGVCQTATTLFNNAFELGLPIVERHNHSFYISHYPTGRDATVSWGGPDFAFRNDLEHALLIKTSYTSATLTFSFYGTGEGRRVTAREGPKENWRQPTMSYALDPWAPRGSVRVERGSHQSGFDVTVFRTVTKDGKTLRKDAFESHYIPVGDTHIYGPGRAIPGSYFVIPRT